MIKRGFMLIGDAEYDLYELKARNFYRFDIIKKGGEFHLDEKSVLFSRYKKKRRKWYGDATLYQKYIDTVTFLQKMHGETISESKWEKEPSGKVSSFTHIVQKGEKGNRLVTQTKNGEWYGEIYEYNGVTIVMRVDDKNFEVALLPVNSYDFVYEASNL